MKSFMKICFVYSDDEKIGCFIISLKAMQKEIDHIHRRYWEALTSSLYASIHEDALKIDIFTSKAFVLFENPSTSEEFSQAMEEFNDLLRSTPEVLKIYYSVNLLCHVNFS